MFSSSRQSLTLHFGVLDSGRSSYPQVIEAPQKLGNKMKLSRGLGGMKVERLIENIIPPY
jgi:hypothetical protein